MLELLVICAVFMCKTLECVFWIRALQNVLFQT